MVCDAQSSEHHRNHVDRIVFYTRYLLDTAFLLLNFNALNYLHKEYFPHHVDLRLDPYLRNLPPHRSSTGAARADISVRSIL